LHEHLIPYVFEISSFMAALKSFPASILSNSAIALYSDFTGSIFDRLHGHHDQSTHAKHNFSQATLTVD